MSKAFERPSMEQLKEVLVLVKNNHTQAGKIFGVCDNTIKKWAIFYGLYNKRNVKKRFMKQGYFMVYAPEMATRTNGYILEHRYIMSIHLGRKLLKEEVVHHKDGNRSNNELSNLILMTSSEHATHHNTPRLSKVKVKCQCCSKMFEALPCNIKKGYSKYCSRECFAKMKVKVACPPKDQLIELKSKHNFEQLSEMFGVSWGTVYRWWVNYGLTEEDNRYICKKRDKPAPTKEQLIELESKHTFKQIGEMFGVSRTTVARWMRIYGLPRSKNRQLF